MWPSYKAMRYTTHKSGIIIPICFNYQLYQYHDFITLFKANKVLHMQVLHLGWFHQQNVINKDTDSITLNNYVLQNVLWFKVLYGQLGHRVSEDITKTYYPLMDPWAIAKSTQVKTNTYSYHTNMVTQILFIRRWTQKFLPLDTHSIDRCKWKSQPNVTRI